MTTSTRNFKQVKLSGGRILWIPLALDSNPEGGRWVTIDGGTPNAHPLFIKDGAGFVPMHLRADAGESKRFTRAALERKLIEHHEEYGGGHTAHADDELSSFINPFKFHPDKHGKLPEEIANQIGPNSPLRSLITLAKPGEIAHGEDAMGHLGQDRYLDIAHGLAEGKLTAAKRFAEQSPDPEISFLNSIHDHLPTESRAGHRAQHTKIVNAIASGNVKRAHIEAELAKQKARGQNVDEVAAKAAAIASMRKKAAEHAERAGSSDTKQIPVKAGELRVGSKFKVHNHEFRVAEDEMGNRILQAGHDYPDTPVDALSTIPVDEGSFRQARHKKAKAEEIPFSDESAVRLVRLSGGRTVEVPVLALSGGNPNHDPTTTASAK